MKIRPNSHRTRDATHTQIGTFFLWSCLRAVWTLPLMTTGPICFVLRHRPVWIRPLEVWPRSKLWSIVSSLVPKLVNAGQSRKLDQGERKNNSTFEVLTLQVVWGEGFLVRVQAWKLDVWQPQTFGSGMIQDSEPDPRTGSKCVTLRPLAEDGWQHSHPGGSVGCPLYPCTRGGEVLTLGTFVSCTNWRENKGRPKTEFYSYFSHQLTSVSVCNV